MTTPKEAVKRLRGQSGSKVKMVKKTFAFDWDIALAKFFKKLLRRTS